MSEVCFEVGYRSLGTFCTRFKELVGLPPGRMRSLPEELHAAFERAEWGSRSPLPGATLAEAGITCRIGGDDLDGKWVFVGPFSGAIPQGRPAAGVLADEPGVCRLGGPVPDG